MKRGQVSLYVIIGILILLITGSILYLKSYTFQSLFQKQAQEIASLPPQVQEIQHFVESCIQQVGTDSVYYTGQFGGYFEPPPNSFQGLIPYYFNANKNFVPPITTLERALSRFVDENVQACTKNFTTFTQFTIRQQKPKTNAIISADKIVYTVHYPLEIKKENSLFHLTDFTNVAVPMRIGTMHNISAALIAKTAENPTGLCITCLINLGIDHDIKTQAHSYNQKTFLVTLTDAHDPKTIPYDYTFAIQLP